MSKRSLERMFDRYTKNWEQVKQAPGLASIAQWEDIVFCPICFKGFGRSQLDELSIEHVPPEALGGKARTFTCKACNNGAGSKLESDLAKFVNFRGFSRGISGSQVDATYSINGGDVQLPATVSRPDAQTWQIIGDPHRTKPGEIQKQTDKLKTGPDNAIFTMHLKPDFRAGWPEIALLRIAYLWTFSVFGYSFLFNPNLEAVRQQIASPGTKILPTCGFVEDEFSDEMLGMNLIIEPAHFRSLFVIVDLVNKLGMKLRVGIILPLHITPATDLYAALMQHQSGQLPFNVSLRSMSNKFDFLEQPNFLYTLSK